MGIGFSEVDNTVLEAMAFALFKLFLFYGVVPAILIMIVFRILGVKGWLRNFLRYIVILMCLCLLFKYGLPDMVDTYETMTKQ